MQHKKKQTVFEDKASQIRLKQEEIMVNNDAVYLFTNVPIQDALHTLADEMLTVGKNSKIGHQGYHFIDR